MAALPVQGKRKKDNISINIKEEHGRCLPHHVPTHVLGDTSACVTAPANASDSMPYRPIQTQHFTLSYNGLHSFGSSNEKYSNSTAIFLLGDEL